MVAFVVVGCVGWVGGSVGCVVAVVGGSVGTVVAVVGGSVGCVVVVVGRFVLAVVVVIGVIGGSVGRVVGVVGIRVGCVIAVKLLMMLSKKLANSFFTCVSTTLSILFRIDCSSCLFNSSTEACPV